ncbi:MAG TPA: MauE/DoxX family redox-associated membrane protein [Ktedonobacteraceae bacterium]|jgi:hypothetical protein
MAGIYLLAFCRITIGLTFALAAGRKALTFGAFQQTLRRLRLLPPVLTLPTALLFVGCEALVALLMVCQAGLLLAGFALAALLLALFSGALLSVLLRGISTACHCFGPGQRPVSRTDLWRNLGFFLCALGGYAGAASNPETGAHLDGAGWLLAGLGAAAFVLIWTQLAELVQVFHGS